MKNHFLRKYRGRLIVAAIFFAIIILLRFTGVGESVTLENFKANRLAIQQIINNYYFWSVMLYILIFIVVVSFALPLALVLTIVGGFLFGVIEGAVYANIGGTIGACISFLMVRYLLGDFLQAKFADQLTAFNEEFNRHGALYMLSVHLVPVVPFFIINTVAGLTKMSLWTFFWTTSVGVIPGSLLYTFAGQELMTIQKATDIFSPQVLIAFLLLSAFSLVTFFVRRYSSRVS